MTTALLVRSLEHRLPKRIGARTHGLIDYAYATFFFCAGAFLWRSNRRAAVASLAVGGIALAQSTITDYPLGLVPVIDFETHGRIDAALASVSLVAPQLLGFANTPAARLFQLNAVVTAAVVGLTNYRGSKDIPVS